MVQIKLSTILLQVGWCCRYCGAQWRC